jgi:hypothetical protein
MESMTLIALTLMVGICFAAEALIVHIETTKAGATDSTSRTPCPAPAANRELAISPP